MALALVMLFGPIAVYLASLPFAKRMRCGLRLLYVVLCGLVVFAGSGTSVYFAYHGGDQGGIPAYFMQLAVIIGYLTLSGTLVILNFLKGTGNS